MKMDFSYYRLTPIKQLNRFHQGEIREGVLFRINGGECYVDYHAWEVFGDLSAQAYIEKMRKFGADELLLHLIMLAKNHGNIEHRKFLNHGFNQSEQKVNKFKFTDLSKLNSILTQYPAGKKIRIDFNNSESLESIKNWWQELDNENKKKIDYLEDPFPFETAKWQELLDLDIPLALDRNPKDHNLVAYEIYKPNIDLYAKNQRLKIFSSYMGHDLGRYHAYLALLKWGDLKMYHGIDTPGLYHEQRDLFLRKGDYCQINQLAVKELYEELQGLVWQKLIS